MSGQADGDIYAETTPSEMTRIDKMTGSITVLIAVTTLVLLALSCGPPDGASADDYGAAWPLKVDKVRLHCMGEPDLPIIWMSADGHHYALTGFSQTYLNKHHSALILRDLSDIQIVGRSIGPLQEQARALCD